MPRKTLRLLKYIKESEASELGRMSQVRQALDECLLEGRIFFFQKLKPDSRVDSKFLVSLAYEVFYTEKQYFNFVLRKPPKTSTTYVNGTTLVEEKDSEVIVYVDKTCTFQDTKNRLVEEIEERKTPSELKKSCQALEKKCKILSIKIEGKSKSSSSESIYYRLSKEGKICEVRMSCHPYLEYIKGNLDFVFGRDNLQELFRLLKEFFKKNN